jgi:ATP-dependent DNA ligase
VRSCVIDGEAVACNGDGLSIFEKLRWRHHDERVFMWSFDLLALDGQDLRREPIEVRKATLASVLRSCRAGLQFNQHLEHPGDIVFRHACKMGLEGIVSKRLGSRYVSGRSRDWLKFKNPSHPAVQREFEEDCPPAGRLSRDIIQSRRRYLAKGRCVFRSSRAPQPRTQIPAILLPVRRRSNPVHRT